MSLTAGKPDWWVLVARQPVFLELAEWRLLMPLVAWAATLDYLRDSDPVMCALCERMTVMDAFNIVARQGRERDE